VRSYFEPPIDVKNLKFAIKWFCMKASYREATLITAMTVLENLIDSNLSEQDTLILPQKIFEKLRKALSNEIKSQSKDWASGQDERDAYVKELCVRLSELKRRSLMDKIALLAKRWGVDLNGIPDGGIQGAKRARDQVVHRGHYQPTNGSSRDLHDHVLTIREVVVRSCWPLLASREIINPTWTASISQSPAEALLARSARQAIRFFDRLNSIQGQAML